jgi:hypothetical protein
MRNSFGWTIVYVEKGTTSRFTTFLAGSVSEEQQIRSMFTMHHPTWEIVSMTHSQNDLPFRKHTKPV